MKILIILISIIPMLLSCNPQSTNINHDSHDSTKTSKDTLKTAEPLKSFPTIDKKYLLGHVNEKKDSLFVEIPVPVANRAGLYLRKEALKAFQEMRDAAKEEGVHLKILSAYRSFNYQKWIWNSKFEGKRKSGGRNMLSSYPDPKERVEAILNYSAMPGTSRHHWGTDIDINSVNTSYFQSGKGKKVYDWLVENAAKYGYYQVYTAGRKDGYNEEHWHWSYMPLAEQYYYNFSKTVTYEDIKGFKGSEYARELDVINRFVLNNINPKTRLMN